MADNYCLAIDAMGGDAGPRVTVPATCNFLSKTPQVSVVLLGDQSAIQQQLDSQRLYKTTELNNRITIIHCDQSVSMGEKPIDAVRNKPNSSLKIGLDMLANDQVVGFVSAGNTGALVAMSVVSIGTLEGMQRPAICTAIPTQKGYAYMLDMGANPVCSPQQLHQFATAATHLYKLLEQGGNPSVGLLNIGVEAMKGTREIRDAGSLIESDASLNYGGFVEGDKLFGGDIDIVVCDGFSGNIALKSTEGVAKMIMATLKQYLRKSWLSRIGVLLARPAVRRLQRHFDPELYNGACLLGLKKVVIKSHGGATSTGFERALFEATKHIRLDIPRRLAERIAAA